MKSETEPREQKTRERITLDLAPKDLDRLNNLEEITGSATRAETIRKSIRIHAFLARKAAEGNDIHISAEGLKDLVESLIAVYSTTPPKSEASQIKKPLPPSI